MTSREAIKRARSHEWVEINPEHEQCGNCLLILHKSTDLENVPACPGRLVIKR